MTAISNYSQNLFSKESALNFAGTVGAGLLSARFLPISIKEAGVVSAAAGTLSTMGQALLGKDADPFKKSLVTIGAFALTYFGTAALAPTLSARFAITLAPKTIAKILAFNAVGQVVSFGLAKLLIVTPWNMSETQIKALYKKYEEDAELFTKLPAIEQQLVYSRFTKLELDTTALTYTQPSGDDIAALTKTEVHTLHQHEVVVENDDLLLRYFELNLKPFEAIEKRIPKLELKQPETVKEVESLSEEKLAWYKLYYTKNNTARKKLPHDVQWALYSKDKVVSIYSFNPESLETAPEAQIRDVINTTSLQWWVKLYPSTQKAFVERAKALEIEIPHPVHPTKPEEVTSLDPKVVEAYNKNFPSGLDKEVIKAFNQRFYEMKLPLPNGQTINQLANATNPIWPQIALELPKTPEDVDKLHDNQMAWVYAFIHENDGFSSLSFEMQSAMNDRLYNVLKAYRWLNTDQLTAENAFVASRTTLHLLHYQLHVIFNQWKELPADVIGALDARFAAQYPTDKLLESEVKNYHMLFATRPECWGALAKVRQQALRQQFDKYPELKQLRLNWY
ncbi:hypothetical protein [Simkania sp.]|uniref:hypothetical protein n=1 Tax=Simkania sp. TaxID=34094 RepID=UPI003B517A0D